MPLGPDSICTFIIKATVSRNTKNWTIRAVVSLSGLEISLRKLIFRAFNWAIGDVHQWSLRITAHLHTAWWCLHLLFKMWLLKSIVWAEKFAFYEHIISWMSVYCEFLRSHATDENSIGHLSKTSPFIMSIYMTVNCFLHTMLHAEIKCFRKVPRQGFLSRGQRWPVVTSWLLMNMTNNLFESPENLLSITL